MLYQKFRFLLAALILAATPALAAVTELGPNGEGLDVPADDSSRYLGNTYKDEAAGFEIAPPAGARIIARGGLELVSFVRDEKQWGGSVQAVTIKVPMNVKQYMAASVQELGKSFKGVQVVESKELTFGKYKAGRLSVSMEADVPIKGATANAQRPGAMERIAVFRQDLIIPMSEDNTKFTLLTFYTPQKDRAEAEKIFDAMLKSFVVYNKEEIAKKRATAVKAAKEWLTQRSADELKSKLEPQHRFFKMQVAGKEVGYMEFVEQEGEQVKMKGVLIAVESHVFPSTPMVVSPGVTVSHHHVLNSAFWAYSHDESGGSQGFASWDNRTKSEARGASLQGGAYDFWFQETGQLIEQSNTRLDPATLAKLQKEREDLMKNRDLPRDQVPPPIDETKKVSHLIVNCSGDKTQEFTETNKGLDIYIPDYRPAVLPKVLEYTWPRLVDLSKPSEMTFVVYSSASRKLTLRTLSVKGPAKISLDGRLVNCTRCLDEMDNMGTTVWVDSSGRILRMLTSDGSVLEPITEADMKRKWDARLRGN